MSFAATRLSSVVFPCRFARRCRTAPPALERKVGALQQDAPGERQDDPLQIHDVILLLVVRQRGLVEALVLEHGDCAWSADSSERRPLSNAKSSSLTSLAKMDGMRIGAMSMTHPPSEAA